MARARGWGEWRWVYGAIVLVTLGFFLYNVRSVLSPFILFLLLLLLLSPYAGTARHTRAVIGLTVLLVIWLLKTTGFLLAPFLLALVFAYILDPLVDILERRRVPRGVAIILLGLPVLAGLTLALVFGIPALADQFTALAAQAPEAVARVAAWIGRARGWLLSLDLPFVREEAVFETLRTFDAERLSAILQARQEEIAQRTWNAVLGLGRGLGTLLGILGYVVLTPVLTFYLLRDYDGIATRLRALIPAGKRAAWLAFAGEYNLLLSRYLRGQLLAAATVGVLTGLLLWIAQFPYAGLVGAVAGVFNLVPYLGLAVSLIPALLIALLSGNILASLLKVAVVFVLVQLLDSTVLGPRIVGGSVGLHPVWVILALAVGGFFLGFVGLLLAVPTAVFLKLLLRGMLERYQRSAVFLGETPVERP
ncbi:MAG TPA: AI-2E family transporter [Longimicrobiales bacterium]